MIELDWTNSGYPGIWTLLLSRV